MQRDPTVRTAVREKRHGNPLETEEEIFERRDFSNSSKSRISHFDFLKSTTLRFTHFSNSIHIPHDLAQVRATSQQVDKTKKYNEKDCTQGKEVRWATRSLEFAQARSRESFSVSRGWRREYSKDNKRKREPSPCDVVDRIYLRENPRSSSFVSSSDPRALLSVPSPHGRDSRAQKRRLLREGSERKREPAKHGV